MSLVFFKVTQVWQMAIKWDSLDHSQWVLYDSVTWRTTITRQWCGNAVIIFVDVARDWHFATSFHAKSLNAMSTSHQQSIVFGIQNIKRNNNKSSTFVSWKLVHISVPLLRIWKKSPDTPLIKNFKQQPNVRTCSAKLLCRKKYCLVVAHLAWVNQLRDWWRIG